MRLRQALANLLDNAVKYTPPGGHVRLGARRETGVVVLECEDDGPGIAPDDLPRIWDRLYRGDRSRAERGLGLGLSLVRAIARAHLGERGRRVRGPAAAPSSVSRCQPRRRGRRAALHSCNPPDTAAVSRPPSTPSRAPGARPRRRATPGAGGEKMSQSRERGRRGPARRSSRGRRVSAMLLGAGAVGAGLAGRTAHAGGFAVVHEAGRVAGARPSRATPTWSRAWPRPSSPSAPSGWSSRRRCRSTRASCRRSCGGFGVRAARRCGRAARAASARASSSSADGYVLTNNHVVDGAEKVKVELPDRRTLDAKVVGTDAPSDLARAEDRGQAACRRSRSATPTRLRVGDVVLAFGNPLGVGQTVTMGIVSAKGRATGVGDGSFEDFLQTDAPINQGNSGGALVDTRRPARRHQLADPLAVGRQHRHRLRDPVEDGRDRHDQLVERRAGAPRAARRDRAGHELRPRAEPGPRGRAGAPSSAR